MSTARAAAPTISPNNSIPGTAEFEKLAGGMMTVGLIAAALGFLISISGMGLARHSHNVHLRDRFKTGAGISLLGTVAFGAANRPARLGVEHRQRDSDAARIAARRVVVVALVVVAMLVVGPGGAGEPGRRPLGLGHRAVRRRGARASPATGSAR